MVYSKQRIAWNCYIIREHESGGLGDPWTGWSCTVKRKGRTGIIHAAPGKPKEIKKLFALAIEMGFRRLIWMHEGARKMHSIVVNLEIYNV